MTLNEIVSVIRDVARVNLRLLKVNELRADLLSLNNSLDAARKTVCGLVERSEKAIAVARFKTEQLNTADPELEAKTKTNEETVNRETERVAEFKADLEREEAGLGKQIGEVSEEIAKVEDGSTKVCKDDLQTESVRLLRALGKQNAEDGMTKAVNAEF